MKAYQPIARRKFTTEELVKKQIQLEYDMRDMGIARFLENDSRVESNAASQTSYFNSLITHTVEDLSDTINAFYDHYENRKGSRPSYLKLIRGVATHTIALIALRSTIDLISCTKARSLASICSGIGSRIEDQIKFSNLKDSAPFYYEKVMESMKTKGTSSYSHKKRTLDKAAVNVGVDHIDWKDEELTQVGSFLVDLVANLDVEGAPLLTKVTVQVTSPSGKPTKETTLAPNKHILAWIEKFKHSNEVLKPALSPCVIPPRDWITPFEGGYHLPEIASTVNLVRGSKKNIKSLTYETMPLVYNTINELQRVKWKINTNVLEVLDQVLECGLPLGIPQIEPFSEQLRPAPIPASLSAFSGKELVSRLTEEQKEEFFTWKSDASDVYTADIKREAELVQLTRLRSEASRYNKFDEFYFVYTMDYRSRVYVESTLLTPQGSDIEKGLIQFADGKKLGNKGMYWLAVQGAGVWAKKDEHGIALDKRSFDERFEAIIDPSFAKMVQNITVDPLSNTEWCEADKPWQFLSWCFEWARLLDWCISGNNPKDFISYCNVAMDGSCSGTQHYAMLLRDMVTARLVNLLPCTEPFDIYREASEIFKTKLLTILTSSKALELEYELDISEWVKHANRNLLKLPVMTLIYGASQMTFRKQIISYLMELQSKEDKSARAMGREPTKKHAFESIGSAAKAALPLIWESVEGVQSAAISGMKFIKKVARFAAKHNKPLKWTTPTGFVVTQEIQKTTQRRVNTCMFGGTKIALRVKTNDIDSPRMASASSPNFIHSMDASHLLLASNDVLNVKKIKSLCVIHDSFSVHACNVDALRESLITTFVEMYEGSDILSDFLDEVEDNLIDVSGIDLPEYGNLDYSEVRKAEYAFS